MPYEKKPECYVTELNRNRIRIFILDDEKKNRHFFPCPQSFTGVVLADLQGGNCLETDAWKDGAYKRPAQMSSSNIWTEMNRERVWRRSWNMDQNK